MLTLLGNRYQHIFYDRANTNFSSQGSCNDGYNTKIVVSGVTVDSLKNTKL